MKIAIVGPDGSGKTTTVNHLHSKLPNSKIIYAGKNKNHKFFLTTITLWIWNMSKKTRNNLIINTCRFFIFYPAEYIENLIRFSFKNKKNIYIYDRHPIDRMIMVYEHDLKKEKNTTRFLFNIWNKVYYLFFVRINAIYMLIPDSELCFKRSNGQYKNLTEVIYKLDAYKYASEKLKEKQRIVNIELTRETTPEDVVDLILSDLDLLKKSNLENEKKIST